MQLWWWLIFQLSLNIFWSDIVSGNDADFPYKFLSWLPQQHVWYYYMCYGWFYVVCVVFIDLSARDLDCLWWFLCVLIACVCLYVWLRICVLIVVIFLCTVVNYVRWLLLWLCVVNCCVCCCVWCALRLLSWFKLLMFFVRLCVYILLLFVCVWLCVRYVVVINVVCLFYFVLSVLPLVMSMLECAFVLCLCHYMLWTMRVFVCNFDLMF